MRREESTANPDPGNGASGPGEPGYDGQTNVGDEGAAESDRVTEEPETQFRGPDPGPFSAC